jgi:Tfp pilus assembly protein PilF
MREFRKAIELDPRSAHAHDNLAAVHAEKKQWREALREYLTALDLEPESAGTHHNLASFLYHHVPEMAAAGFREAIALDPEHPDAHLSLGMVLADEGRVKEARPELEAAVRLAPQDASARHELASLHMDEGDYRAAIAQLKEAVRLDPAAHEAHLDLGICYSQKGFYAEAERAYARAAELAPDDLLVAYNRAALYALWKRPKDCLPHLRQALAADPARVRAWIASDPMFEGMAGDEEFEALVRG